MRHCIISILMTITAFPMLGYDSLPEAVTEAPPGERVMYSRTNTAMYLIWGSLVEGTEPSSAVEIIEGEDGLVYMNYPVSNLHSDPSPWIVGERRGNEIRFTLPQVGFQKDGNDYYVFRMKKSQGSLAPTDSQVFVFVENDGTIYSRDNDIYIGICSVAGNKTDFSGYADTDVVMSPLTCAVNEIPEGLPHSKWALTFNSGSRGHFLDVVQNGDEIWVAGLSTRLPNAYVKGVLHDGTMFFENGQYCGVQPNNKHHAYFMAITEGKWWHEAIQAWYPTTVCDSENGGMRANVEYDENNGISSLEYSGAIAFTTMPDTFDYNYTEQIESGIKLRPDFHKPGMSPASPLNLDALRCNSRHDGFVAFDLPLLDENGYLIDADSLYYNIYFDGELLELTPDEYPMLETPTADVQYDLSYAENGIKFIDAENASARRTFYYFKEGVSVIGVQSIYKEGGKEYRSPIVETSTVLYQFPVGSDVNDERLATVTPRDATVEEGGSITFRIIVERPGARFLSATWDGDDVTDQVVKISETEYEYEAIVESSYSVFKVVMGEPDSVEMTVNDPVINVYISSEGRICGLDNDEFITVANISGQNVYSGNSEACVITVPGIYMVQTRYGVYKIFFNK